MKNTIRSTNLITNLMNSNFADRPIAVYRREFVFGKSL